MHTLTSGPVEVHLMQLGASLHRLVLHDAGGPTGVALVHRTAQEYLDARDFMGATVGRLANRVGGGRVPTGDEVFQVPLNDGPNALHGGPDGFDLRTWSTVEVGDTSVTFRLEGPDGDQGLPGTVEVLVTYALQGMSVTSTTEVRTDAPTRVNLTNHSFFNLEPQHFPDTPNQPSFPSCLVLPGEPQVSTLVWELGSEG